MKTIQISDEDFKFLEELAKEMHSQNNRSTQYPMFCIQETVKDHVPSECADGKSRIEDSDGDLCKECSSKYEDDGDIPDDCDDCDDECFWHWRKEDKLSAGDTCTFFTAKACEEHIASNNYHYSKPVSFGVCAWRNYEMQNVMKFILSNFGKKEIPSQYK